MIKIKRDKQGVVQTAIKGGAHDIVEELLNATISIIEMLEKRVNYLRKM